jgi:hypothetical protein
MLKAAYRWRRFWCARDGRIDLSDRGYLSDPETEYGRYANSSLLGFEEIGLKPCLALLGEPGIGKSSTLRSAYEGCLGDQSKAGDIVERVDLRSYGDEKRLVDRLFNGDSIREWRSSDRHLHLFIDSLDECLLRVDSLASLLPEELEKQPLERLSLRIACRTAIWPRLLEQELERLWPDGRLGVYELAPLRQCDVAEAARAETIDPQDFLKAVEQAEAVPFAIRPVTLQMLFSVYKPGGRFPATRAELYEKGIRHLTEETNESRIAASRRGSLSSDQRLAVAGRIAAVTVFSNRFAVWKETDSGGVPSEDVQIAELTGNTELARGNAFEIGDSDIEETLDTGLFSSRGAGRMGWSHQTYAEFLAARYLLQHDMSLGQVMSILRHPGEPTGKIVPQLHEVAAWVGIQRADVFDAILPADPAVLLRSDIATADEHSRGKVAKAFLEALDANKLHDIWSDFPNHYRKLANPTLPGLLRSYIAARTKGATARRAAILIAESCAVSALAEDLLRLALHAAEDEHLRAMAVSALGSCGDEQAFSQLKPLAVNSADGDSQDGIKGSALSLLWPKYLTAAELFAALQPKKRPEYVGSYAMFIGSAVVRHLQPSDLPVALSWVRDRESGVNLTGKHLDRDFDLSKLADEIVLLAFRKIGDSTDTQQRVAKVLIQRLRAHYTCAYEDNGDEFEKALRANAVERRLLFKALVCEMSDDPREAFSVSRVVPVEDLAWLLQSAIESEKQHDNSARKFAHLAGPKYKFEDIGAFDRIYAAAQESKSVAEEFA